VFAFPQHLNPALSSAAGPLSSSAGSTPASTGAATGASHTRATGASHSRVRGRRALSTILACAIASLVMAAFGAAPAGAALISTGACNEAELTQPFAPWGETTEYELVPGGHFDGSLSGWTVQGKAGLVAGGEPYGVTGSVSSDSLALGALASAQSPWFCVNASYPTFRFFARNSGLLSTVLVQVVDETPLGPVVLPVGVVALSGQWQPTAPMLTGSAVEGLLSGGTAQVALRFTEVLGESRIDDVFVDPRMR
jgi:hypothetical protein